MPSLPLSTLRASFAVLVLGLAASLGAAEKEKEKPVSFMGNSRDQVYSRLGEPRSVMKAGAREIMFFPKVKLTLRSGVVVETEEIYDEPPPPSRRIVETPAPAPAAQAATDATDSGDAARARKSGATQTAAQAAAADAAAAAKSNEAAAAADAKASASPIGGALEIKFVRPPPANAPRPLPRPAVKPATDTVSPPVASTAGSNAASASAPKSTVAPAASSVAVTALTAPASAGRTATAPFPAASSSPAVSTVAIEEKPATAAELAGENPDVRADQKSKAKTPPKRFLRRRADGEAESPDAPLFTTQTYLFGFALVGAVAFLIWRSRQRKLELAVTTVSNTPFEEPVAVDASTLFTAELLAKLEWKRFEELVAFYYVKTGVVAVRTKTGHDSPVHLKISWKGESKPFACVQCHANPVGLIRPPPLQGLFAALTVDDIRRGYVVTNGKFNVEARDYAEEKHFTLLPGDILLEKLNALPPAARSELMNEITKGDYTTPTCPKCDVKMVKTDDGGWRCTNAPRCEAVIPPRKA